MTKLASQLSGLVLGACVAIAIALGAHSTLAAAGDDDTAARCGKCGDGTCTPSCGETATSCPRDCGTPSALADEPTDDARCSKCGDGACTPSCGETATSCPRDCGTES